MVDKTIAAVKNDPKAKGSVIETHFGESKEIQD